jgi:hypothetical protein
MTGQFRGLLNKIRDIFLTTKIEILLGMVVFAIIGGIWSYRSEHVREYIHPLAFSERHQLEKDSEGRLSIIARYLTTHNDLIMKVLECENSCRGPEIVNVDKQFARELRLKSAKDRRYFYSLDTLFNLARSETMELKAYFTDYANKCSQSSVVRGRLASSWNRRYHDNEHSEIRWRTVCSGSGSRRSCHPETYFVTVYDNTTYWYDYNPGEGAMSAQMLSRMRLDSTILWPEKLPQPSRIGTDNGFTIQKTVRAIQGRAKTIVMPTDSISYFANLWRTGATLEACLPGIEMSWPRVLACAKSWIATQPLATSTMYIRCDQWHQDKGPPGYQLVNNTVESIDNFDRQVQNLFSNVDQNEIRVHKLEEQIKRYVDSPIKKDHHDIVIGCENLYKSMFSHGLPMQRYRWWMIPIWIFISCLLGSGVGAVVDFILDQKTRSRNG